MGNGFVDGSVYGGSVDGSVGSVLVGGLVGGYRRTGETYKNNRRTTVQRYVGIVQVLAFL